MERHENRGQRSQEWHEALERLQAKEKREGLKYGVIGLAASAIIGTGLFLYCVLAPDNVTPDGTQTSVSSIALSSNISSSSADAVDPYNNKNVDMSDSSPVGDGVAIGLVALAGFVVLSKRR